MLADALEAGQANQSHANTHLLGNPEALSQVLVASQQVGCGYGIDCSARHACCEGGLRLLPGVWDAVRVAGQPGDDIC